MKRNSKYVGLDVHQAMTAATVRMEGWRVVDADDLSEQLRVGGLRAVYHGSRERADHVLDLGLFQRRDDVSQQVSRDNAAEDRSSAARA